MGQNMRSLEETCAQNHSLQSSLAAMMYGVLWEDEHLYQVGLDSYLITLASVNEDGVLELEAIRGGSGLFYSGATLHTLLQIREIAKESGAFSGRAISRDEKYSRCRHLFVGCS